MSFAPPQMPSEPQRAALPSSGLAIQRAGRDRAPAWLLFLSALVVVAMVAGAAYVVLDGGTDYPDEWDPRVAPIADWVEGERGLEFEHPVEVEFLTAEEYTAVTTGDDATDEEAADMDDFVAQFRALGLIEGEVDMEEAGDTLSDTGTLAFYNFRTERVIVRGTDLTPQLRVTLAHELTHVLQDQHFDLGRIESLPEERSSVLRALGEGDAERIEDVYVEEILSDDERDAYRDESDSTEEMEEIDAKVPPVLTTLVAAPYIFGPVLVDHLERVGDDALEEAFRDPPSEQVLFDPLLWDTDEADPLTVEVTSPEGAEVLQEGGFGPTAWYLVLAARMEPRIALAATDGLGGDDFVSYRQGGEVCVRIYARGDDADETDELAAALGVWVAQSPEGRASVEVVDGTIHFQSCDPGVDAEAAGEVSVDLLGLPVIRSQLYLEVLEAGGTDAQGRCYAEGIVERLSFEQLTADDVTPDVRATIVDLQRSCS